MLVTATVTAAILIPQNAMRKSMLIQNNDATDAVYVKRERTNSPTVSSTNYDFRVGPGAAFGISSLLDGVTAITDSYTVIAAANTPVVAVFETEDIGR